MSDTRDNRPPRRRRTDDEKRRIVEETLVTGASVSVVARRHDVNANQVFAWRRLYQGGALGAHKTETALVPVGVMGRDGTVSPIIPDAKGKRAQHASALSISEPSISAPCFDPCRDGKAPSAVSQSHAVISRPPTMIEVELRGGSRIRIDGQVKGVALQQVLKLIRALA